MSAGVRERARRLAGRPGVVLLLLALGALLHGDLVSTGLHDDDYLLLAALDGESRFTGHGPSLWEAFDFGTPGSVASMKETGVLPWWADPGFRMRFCRPVAAATHWLDLHLLDGAPAAMHAHSLLWFLLAVLAAWIFYRSLLGSPEAASFAGLLFVAAPQLRTLVGWVASRSALLALVFAALALVCHVRWRRSGDSRWLPIGLALTLLGLLSSEAVAAVPLVAAAHAVCLEPGSRRERLAGVLPLLGLLLVWWIGYQAGGHGAAGSGIYLAPNPTDGWFLGELLRRYLALLPVALGMGVSVDLIALGPAPLPALLWGFGLLATGALLLLIRPLLREDPSLRFWTLSLALAALPCSLAMPSDRVLGLCLLLTPGFVTRLMQRILALRRAPSGWGEVSPVRRKLLGGLLGILAARFVLLHPFLGGLYHDPMLEVAAVLESSATRGALASRDLAGRTLWFVNPPGPNLVECLPSIRRYLGRSTPQAMRILFPGFWPLRLTRLDARTLEAELDGDLLEHFYSRIYRRPDRPLAAGTEVRLEDVVYRVEAVGPGGAPVRLRLEFAEPLDTPAHLWLAWHGDRYEVHELPPIGVAQRLPPAVPEAFLLGTDSRIRALVTGFLGGEAR